MMRREKGRLLSLRHVHVADAFAYIGRYVGHELVPCDAVGKRQMQFA